MTTRCDSLTYCCAWCLAADRPHLKSPKGEVEHKSVEHKLVVLPPGLNHTVSVMLLLVGFVPRAGRLKLLWHYSS